MARHERERRHLRRGDSGPGRIKPHQLALVLGIGIGRASRSISGILPQITGWENDNAVHRTVFVNIPGPLQIAFYTVIPVLLVWVARHVRQPDEELGARCARPARARRRRTQRSG